MWSAMKLSKEVSNFFFLVITTHIHIECCTTFGTQLQNLGEMRELMFIGVSSSS